MSPRLSIRRSREILVKSKNATRLGGEVVRHLAWGEKDIIALQERIERHKQSLGLLYLTVLERCLRSCMQSQHRPRSTRPPLDWSASFSFPIDAGVTYATDRYQAILAAVERQREFAMLERNRAETGEDEEWRQFATSLIFSTVGVLNAIERKVNASAQHGNGSWPSHYELNKALLSQNAIAAPLKRASTENDASHHEPTSPLPPLYEEVISFSPPSRTSTTSTVDSIDPLTVNNNISGTKRTPSSTTRREKQKHEEQKLQPRPPISPSSKAESPRRPSFASSNGSGGQRSWNALQLNRWVKVFWDGCPSLSGLLRSRAGHRSDGRLYAIKAVDLQDTQRQLPIIKCSATSSIISRSIPHTEQPGPRDGPADASRVYFVNPPIMKQGEESVQYFFENQKDQFTFQSLIYGREPILAIIIQKISSAPGKESDRQYIRNMGSHVAKTSSSSSLFRYCEIQSEVH
ncbi:hypothetical protein ACJ73_04149 [Blastomyces percursus]|uniref:Uncharacterized protein n=1 Tax=Blastomyces percursus TaxID=1658174 RepID=A0A1J9QW96_9EURO|nr:hypothetical protein ACJ73_04149 [Blastomyces percursus]